MTRLLIGLLIGCSATLHAETYTYKLDIRPNPKANWGAGMRDVSAVLNSTASELYRYFPDRNLKPILVEPQGGPIVLFRRGRNGEFNVRLSTGKTYWSQYAFQFAHEFCHILCRYDDDKHPNKWFEESICECASLFALRAMGKSWAVKAPYPNWKSYGKSLTSYAQDRLDKLEKFQNQPFTDWYRSEAKSLAAKADQREKNLYVASQILPLLEAQPERWESVSYLNVSQGTPDQDFNRYLNEWYKNAPRKHGPFIEAIAELLGITLSPN